MKINNGNFGSIEQVTGEFLKQQNQVNVPKTLNGKLFSEILEETSGLKFSKHANERLISRGINLSNDQMNRLNEGTARAREKGIRESLVVVDNLAFIVNVRNNTVVTAVGDSDDKIFTNIDGAVIN